MAGMSWVKLHTDILGDPKLMRAARNGAPDLELLPWLIAFAGRANDNGRLSVGTEAADEHDFAEGVPNVGPARMRSLVAVLLRLEILVPEDDGVLAFAAWDRRAGKPSDQPEAVRERVQRHREAKKSVTPRNALHETRGNATEGEEEGEGEGDSHHTTPRADGDGGDALERFTAGEPRAAVTAFLAAVPAAQRLGWRWRLLGYLDGQHIAKGVTEADVAAGLRDYLLAGHTGFGPKHVRSFIETAHRDRERGPPTGITARPGRAPRLSRAEANADYSRPTNSADQIKWVP